MDPNETLAWMRPIASALLHEEFDAAGGINAACQLAEYVEALDEWLTKGGFPPAAWKRTVWSLTVKPFDDDRPAITTLHPSEEEAVESLERHGDEVERHTDSVITDLENWGYTITIDKHEV